jgi:hypothetical protein
MTETPKVFISYSWTTPNHEDWVINLAERLVADGVDVIIDKWNLKEGHDKYDFMETMVKSTEIDKVLIILDKKYAEKAEQRSGGVGTETQIISPSVYANVSQEKFIPIIAERDETGKAFVPTYLESRIYIDLSSQDNYEENYEKLLRNIYKRPAYNKPQLGKAPVYLIGETPMTHKTSTILRSFNNQISKNPSRVNSILREFLSEFFENLKDYSVILQARDYVTIGKEIYDKLNLFMPLRNDFISFFERITKEDLEFDIDILIRFLEKLPLLKSPLDQSSNWSDTQFEIFKFIIHELFLYLVAIGLKNENYKFVEELFYSHYIFQDKYNYKNEPKTFGDFYHYVEIMDAYYKQTFSKGFFSPMADFIIKRIPQGFTKDMIVEADLLCHYVAVLNNFEWFPITYVYKLRGSFELFDRMISKRHFEKIKFLFGVTTADELKKKLESLERSQTNTKQIRYSNSPDYVLPLYKRIDKDKIATTR